MSRRDERSESEGWGPGAPPRQGSRYIMVPLAANCAWTEGAWLDYVEREDPRLDVDPKETLIGAPETEDIWTVGVVVEDA